MLTPEERREYGQMMVNLARDRRRLADVKAQIAEHEKNLREEIEPLINAADDLSHAVKETDNLLRGVGRRLYEEHHTRKLPFGMGIRVTEQIEFDEDEALRWAKSTGLALQLDKKKFENLMKALPEADRPDWVTVGKKTIVTIPAEIAEDEIRQLIDAPDPDTTEVPF